MSHMRLRSLRVKGLRSFVQESKVNFAEEGLTLFRGRNLDSGGSSGSGKSSLLLAISYLFGFCKYPATQLQSWLTEEPLEVEGVVEVGDETLSVIRGAAGLALHRNGSKVKGGAKQLEAELTKFLGLPPELLAALTYRGQKQPGLFLSKTDAEKKEFLTVLLDLGKFEQQVEVSSELVKKMEASLAGQEQVRESIKTQLNSTLTGFQPLVVQDEQKLHAQFEEASQRAASGNLEADQIRAQIAGIEESVNADIEAMEEKAQKEADELDALVLKLEDEQPDLSGVDYSKLQAAEADLQQAHAFLASEQEADRQRQLAQRKEAESVHAQLILLEKKLVRRPVIDRQVEENQKKLVKLSAEITQLEDSTCPTCARPWEDALALMESTKLSHKTVVEEIDQLLKERESISGLSGEVKRLQDEYKRLGVYTRPPEFEELSAIVQTLTAQVAREQLDVQLAIAVAGKDIQFKLAEAQRALASFKDQHLVRVTHFRSERMEAAQAFYDQLDNLNRAIQMANAQAAAAQAALGRVKMDNVRAQERNEAHARKVAELQAALAQSEGSVATWKKSLEAEMDFQRLIGREGFLGAIFDEVLWEISEETNRVLAQFPNTAHVTLAFRSEAVSAKGVISKKIVPIVSIGGFEAPLSSGLSGGMETAVELAVDLAVAQVVSRRTGRVPGWLVLDESFTGLGPVEAEACMEILRIFAEDKLVLVVDHASEFKSLFTQFVDVEYTNGHSKVVS